MAKAVGFLTKDERKLDVSALGSIDRGAPLPHYRQIANNIEAGLRGLPPGAVVPSETELVRWFGVSRGTAVRALEELEHRYEVVRVKGMRTFKAHVSPMQFVQRLDAAKLPSFTDDLRREGFEPWEVVHESGFIPAAGPIARTLDVEEGEPVWKISRTITADNRPVVHVTSYLRRDLYPEFVAREVSRLSLYGHLEAEYGEEGRPAWAREAYFAGEAPAWLGCRLGIEEGSSVLRAERVAYLADGRPAEHAYSHMRGDFYRVEVTVLPGLRRESLDRTKMENATWSR